MISGSGEYRKINTMSMSQLDLILSVYKGAIAYMKTAMADFQQGRNGAGRMACDKARKCIVHLYTSLDMDKGQHIARYLGQLYAYIIEQIDLTIGNKSKEQIENVLRVLTTLKDGWEQLKVQEGDAAAMSHAAADKRPVSEEAAGITISA